MASDDLCPECEHAWAAHTLDGCLVWHWLDLCGCICEKPDEKPGEPQAAEVAVALTPGRVSFSTPDGSPLTAAHLKAAEHQSARIRAQIGGQE